MANITISIPDDKLQGIIAAFAAQYNYRDMVPDPAKPAGTPDTFIPNPVTKAQFAKNCVASFIKQVYVSQQARTHEAAVKATIEQAKADTELIAPA